jgi:hypothetical protein
MTSPERCRTLAEVCDLYFPGVSPCALRWMIKRKGLPHSRWGREYRLTDSQVSVIQAQFASPGRQRCEEHPDRAAIQPRDSRPRRTSPPSIPHPDFLGQDGPQPNPRLDPRRMLAERLLAPIPALDVDAGPWHRDISARQQLDPSE